MPEPTDPSTSVESAEQVPSTDPLDLISKESEKLQEDIKSFEASLQTPKTVDSIYIISEISNICDLITLNMIPGGVDAIGKLQGAIVKIQKSVELQSK